MSEKAKKGLMLEGRVPSEWNRFTVADGNWLNENDIKPFSARDEWLAECIDDLEDTVTELGGRKTSNIYLNGESAERLDFKVNDEEGLYSEEVNNFKELIIPSSTDMQEWVNEKVPSWNSQGKFLWMDKEELASESYYKRAKERGSELPNDDGCSVVFGAGANASGSSIATNGASAIDGSFAFYGATATDHSVAWQGGNASSNSVAWGGSNASSNSVAWQGGNASSNSVAWAGGNASFDSVAWQSGKASSYSVVWNGGNASSNSVAWNGANANNASIAWASGNASSESVAWGGSNASSNSVAWNGANANNASIAWGGSSATDGSLAHHGSTATEYSVANIRSTANNDSIAWGDSSAVFSSIAFEMCSAFTIGNFIIPAQKSLAENCSNTFYGSSAVNHSVAFRGSSAIENSIAIKGSIANDNSIAYKGSSTQSGSIAFVVSTAFGGSLAFNRSVATKGSVALADKTTAENHSFAFGQLNSVANYSYGIGYNNEISGGGYALGKGLRKYNGNGSDQTIVGTYNESGITNYNLFIVGDGTTDTNRHNAMLVGRVKNNGDQNSYVSAYDFLLSNRNGGTIDLYDALQAGGGGGGIPEAPIDGNMYGRKDGNWSVVEGGTFTGVTTTGNNLTGNGTVESPLNTNTAINVQKISIYHPGQTLTMDVEQELNDKNTISSHSYTAVNDTYWSSRVHFYSNDYSVNTTGINEYNIDIDVSQLKDDELYYFYSRSYCCRDYNTPGGGSVGKRISVYSFNLNCNEENKQYHAYFAGIQGNLHDAIISKNVCFKMFTLGEQNYTLYNAGTTYGYDFAYKGSTTTVLKKGDDLWINEGPINSLFGGVNKTSSDGSHIFPRS